MKRSYLKPVISTPTAGRADLLNSLTGTVEADPVIGRLHDLIRVHILGPGFACSLGKRSFVRGLYRLGIYDSMGDVDCVSGLCSDLREFVGEQGSIKGSHPDDYSTFIAIFQDPLPVNELDHEASMWRLLQNLHDEDKMHCSWDSMVSSDPNDPDFSFSVGGKALFLVGMHGESSRTSRRFRYPAIAFNSHDQFEDLRLRQRFVSVQQTIRNNDIKIQGAINPSLANYGADSEAKQYSGRLVEQNWVCPFHK